MYEGQIGIIGAILILIWLTFFWKSPEEKFKRKIKKTIEKQKSHFSEISLILTAGIYTVGIDFPQGKYTLTAKEKYGDVITSNNVKNGINRTLGVGYKDIASEFNNLILENGDTLTIDGELVLKLYSQRVNLVVAPREVKGQEISDTAKFTSKPCCLSIKRRKSPSVKIPNR